MESKVDRRNRWQYAGGMLWAGRGMAHDWCVARGERGQSEVESSVDKDGKRKQILRQGGSGEIVLVGYEGN